ncbi:MAG: hypothetical protein KME23_25560 [Goleter apudmare HA4340-LM2]|jgi:cytoskeletal protein RodZ|nr:hypothetical protein [Goleter apudmare HA4340-LM2]
MEQSTQQLLALALAAGLAFVMAPCQAQTARELNEDEINSNSSISSKSSAENTNLSSKLSDSSSSGQSKADITSEVDSNSSSTNNTVPATQPTARIPISSRIFAVPSMQQ